MGTRQSLIKEHMQMNVTKKQREILKQISPSSYVVLKSTPGNELTARNMWEKGLAHYCLSGGLVVISANNGPNASHILHRELSARSAAAKIKHMIKHVGYWGDLRDWWKTTGDFKRAAHTSFSMVQLVKADIESALFGDSSDKSAVY
jgi:hypothetical protein